MHQRPVGIALLLSILLYLGAQPARAQLEEQRNTDAVRSISQRTTSGPDGVEVSQVEARIVELANQFRRQHRRSAVSVNDALTKAARSFAQYLAATNSYGHTADGQRPAERASQRGYENCVILENIAYQWRSTGFESSELALKFVTGWEASPEHRKNMLNPHVTEAGVGVARGEETGTYFAVQMFGRPRSLAIEFQIANMSDQPVEYTVADESFSLPPQYIRAHQRCIPAELVFTFDAEQRPGPAQSPSFTPVDGDYFVVRPTSGGGLTVGKEKPDPKLQIVPVQTGETAAEKKSNRG
jgi:uncharacterized protein YkwD